MFHCLISKILIEYIQYSSKATWYPHACCRLNIVGWRLHYAFNIWTGTSYICARIRQIVWHVHLQMLHSFWMNFNETYNINSIYKMNLRILSLYILIDPLSYWKAAHMQYISCPAVCLGVENGFGLENGFFIGNWISINLFKFVQSVGWKVGKYFLADIS